MEENAAIAMSFSIFLNIHVELSQPSENWFGKLILNSPYYIQPHKNQSIYFLKKEINLPPILRKPSVG